MGTGAEKAFVGGGLSFLGAGFEASEESKAAESSVAGLETEKQEVATAEKQRSVQRMDNLNTIIGTNLTVAASRGIAPSSGSFKAIGSSDFEKFNQDEQMDELNTALKEQQISQQEKAIKEEAKAKEVGGFLGAAGSVISDLL